MSTLNAESRSTIAPLHEPRERFNPVPAVLAFVLPGLGHAYLRHFRRASMIALGCLGLFFGGLLVGGLDSVDRQEDFVWFMGQSLVGPIAFATDSIHQSSFKVLDPRGVRRSARPNEFRNPVTGKAELIVLDHAPNAPSSDPGVPIASYSDASGQRVIVRPAYPPKVKAVGRFKDLGTLFCAVAGMMNLICIIDAAFRRPAPRRTLAPKAGAGA